MNKNFKNLSITQMMIVICVIVYLYTSLRYSFDMTAWEGLMAGALHPVLVLEEHQFYRIISANFIHFGIMHLVCNCYSLYNIGTIMERLLGKSRYFIILLGSMLFTTMIPVWLYFLFKIGSNSVMAGFSGAIFGLIGAIMALAWNFKDVYMYIFKQIAPSVILMLAISFAVPSISLFGHLSGLIGGYIAALVIIYFYPLPSWRKNDSYWNLN